MDRVLARCRRALLVTCLAVVCGFAPTSTKGGGLTEASDSEAGAPQQLRTEPETATPQGAGSIVPEPPVPDHAAYLTVLRVLGSSRNARRNASYVRRMFTTQFGCDQTPTHEDTSPAVSTILRLGDDYLARLTALDARASLLAAGSTQEYAKLNQSKVRLADEFRLALQTELPTGAFVAVDGFVRGHVKSRIRSVR